MIKINLLPTEKRKAERTPLPRFLLIASTAAAFFILLFYNLFILHQISSTKDEIRVQNRALSDLASGVAKHDELAKEEEGLKAKVGEIKSLIHRDVEYWHTVNALWDVINNNPRVWIDDLRVLDSRMAPGELKRVDPETKEVVAYGISMRCHVSGDEVTEMTKFRKALKDNPILQENLTLINFNVAWHVNEEREKGYDETHSIDFEISMFGLSTKPVRKAPAPLTPKSPVVPIKAAPSPAPAQKGAK